jgi:hypothetical protein
MNPDDPNNGAAPGYSDDAPKSDEPMGSGEDCISLSSLAMPDAENGDQMANPTVGDKVNYQVEGTVTRIEGDNAYVKRETINGQPVDDEDSEAGEDPNAPDSDDDQEREQLGGMADQMGGMS